MQTVELEDLAALTLLTFFENLAEIQAKSNIKILKNDLGPSDTIDIWFRELCYDDYPKAKEMARILIGIMERDAKLNDDIPEDMTENNEMCEVLKECVEDPRESKSCIKFRVWDKLREAYIYHDKNKYQGHFNISLDGKFFDCHNGSGGDDYIVQAWTGVKDANGKDIYEGDIVRTIRGEMHPNIGRVYFVAGCFMIDGAGTLYDEVTSDAPDVANDIEVIGNICEQKNEKE